MSPDMEVRARLQSIAQKITDELPPKWGFALLCFPFDDREGLLNYIANGDRKDIIKTMKEFIAKTEAQWGEHVEG